MSMVERLAKKSEARQRPERRHIILGRREARWWLNAIADDMDMNAPISWTVADWLRSQAEETES